MSSVYRGRFAPSPTGPLHFGSLIAAIASYLDAKSHNGEWLLRIEDLDPPRVAAGAVEDILRTLTACGMQWDGGVVYQSLRSDAYRSALHRLRERGLVYGCACSRREIADSALSGIEGPVYPGTCRSGLAPAQTARGWRLCTRGAHIIFEDRVQGTVAQDIEQAVGDFVLYRADHVFTYQLAVVIDDADQGITDVVRGADLLDSTPRQIYLQRLLDLPTPRYLHLPVAINTRGEKLSKQTLALAVDAGHPQPELIAALRVLGHEPPAALMHAAPVDLWRWGTIHWNPARIPRTRTVAAITD